MDIQAVMEKQIVMSKVNGKKYRIVRTEGRYAGAREIDENGREQVGLDSYVSIFADNAVCFQIIPEEPYEIPEGYTVKDGILLKYGEEVKNKDGCYIHRILATVTGKILLDVSLSVESCTHILETYTPSTNKFSYVEVINHTITPVFVESGAVVFAFSEIRKGCNKNNRPVFKLQEAGFVIYDAETDFFRLLRMEHPIDIERVLVMKETNDIKHIIMPFNQKTRKTKEIINCKETVKIITVCKNRFGKLDTIPFAEVKSVTSCLYDDGVLIKSDDSIYFSGTSNKLHFASADASNALEGYDYLVDISCTQRQKVLTFADERHQTKIVALEKTEDGKELITVS